MIKWTDAKVDNLRDNWLNFTDDELASMFNTTKGAIIRKRRRLGLIRKPKAMKNTGAINYSSVYSDFVGGGYVLLTHSVNTRIEKIKYICNKHKDKGIQTIILSDFYRNRGCYYCGRERTVKAKSVSEIELINRCSSLDFQYIGKYSVEGNLYVQYICNKHKSKGVQVKALSNLNKATNCPYCKESRGELRVETYLEKAGSSFIKEKRFSKCRYKYPLPFDFYLPTENIAIEYDGEGHYMPVPFHMSKEKANINEGKLENHLQSIQLRDQIKTDFCLQNGIKLIRIPYWNFDNIEQILDKHLNRIA